MDLPPSIYHLQSLNQLLELSKTNACFRDSHSIWELDVDGDLVDACYAISRILKGLSDRIMHLTLLTHLLCLRPDLGIFFRATSDRDGVNFLMRLAVPFVESRIVRSTSGSFACKELRALCSTRTYSLLQSFATKRTKGSQILLNYIPFVSFLKRGQRYHFP